jgi:branched-chain amino acid transport system permease protein
LAVSLTGIFALILGSVINRMESRYVAFATIALNQILWSVYQNWRAMSGGPDGMSKIPDLGIGSFTLKGLKSYFYVLVILAFFAMIFVHRLRATSFGRSLAAVRDNEIAAKTLGVNVYKTKIISFMIAAMLASASGVMITHQTHYISSATFTFDASITYIIMAMLGGILSAPGTFAGVFLLTVIPEWLRPIQQFIRFVYGFIVLGLMVFMPMGLAGLAQTVIKKIGILTVNIRNSR